VETLLEGGHFFEGPRWRDGRWWVSDFYSRNVQAITPDGSAEEVVRFDGQPSGLGWMPDGTLLVVSMRDHKLLRVGADGSVSEHADVGEHCGGHLNDMVVDAEGRAYVGNFGFDLMAGADPQETVLVRVDPDGTVSVAAGGLRFPNATLITPDGRTMLVNETMAARISAFTIGADGSLSDHRIWAQVADTPPLTTMEEGLGLLHFAPDGGCLDAEGCVWAADALGNRCCRVAEGGEIVEELRAPDGLGIYACMLGGDDGRTLLMCAAPDFFEAPRKAAREAVLLTERVSAPHAGLP
jgi:sugar lactone lactonase YvrE